jgi:hypothetical protein
MSIDPPKADRIKEFFLFYFFKKSKATRGANACAARATSTIRSAADQSSFAIP